MISPGSSATSLESSASIGESQASCRANRAGGRGVAGEFQGESSRARAGIGELSCRANRAGPGPGYRVGELSTFSGAGAAASYYIAACSSKASQHYVISHVTL